MKMYTELGAFTLPSDFNFEVELTNPLFTDEGSSSLPFTLPLTKDNLAATDNPNVLARRERVIGRTECIVQYGTFQLQGLLSVSSLSKSELSGHIMISESRLYSERRDSTIRSIIEYERVYENQLTIQGLARALEYNNEAYISQPEDDDYMPEEIAVFPVVGQFTDTYKLMLNGRVDESDEGGIAYGGLEYTARSIKVGSDTYNVPDGYGLTAFPFLSHIINLILRNLGYKVIRNDFQTQPFCNLVLLNPVADAICGSTLYYKDLVPDITLSDFIEWLYDKFGAVICISGKSASVVLLAKVLQMPFDIDLTEYAEDDETLTIPEVGGVHISADTSLDGAEPVDSEYDYAVHSVGEFTTVDKESQVSYKLGKYIYAKNTGKFYRKNQDGSNSIKTEAFAFSGNMWGDKKEDLSPADLYTPMLSYSLYRPSYAVPYVGPFAHYHTAIKDSEEEEEATHPLMVCWVYYLNGYRCGTVCGHDAVGNRLTYGPDKTPLPALSPTGIYELCWSKYNSMLQDSAPEITVKINLPLHLLQTLDMVCPKRYKGHKVIIKSLSYSVSASGITYGDAKLQLIPEYVFPSSKTPYFPY